MNNNQIIKLSGALAFVSFMFFPIAGCGNFNFSGMDLITGDDVNFFIRILCIGVPACALTIILIKEKLKIFYGALAGIILLFIIYFSFQSELKSKLKNDEFGISNAFQQSIKLKSGSYLCMIGFIISAFVSKAKKELLTVDPSNSQSKTGND